MELGAAFCFYWIYMCKFLASFTLLWPTAAMLGTMFYYGWCYIAMFYCSFSMRNIYSWSIFY